MYDPTQYKVIQQPQSQGGAVNEPVNQQPVTSRDDSWKNGWYQQQQQEQQQQQQQQSYEQQQEFGNQQDYNQQQQQQHNYEQQQDYNQQQQGFGNQQQNYPQQNNNWNAQPQNGQQQNVQQQQDAQQQSLDYQQMNSWHNADPTHQQWPGTDQSYSQQWNPNPNQQQGQGCDLNQSQDHDLDQNLGQDPSQSAINPDDSSGGATMSAFFGRGGDDDVVLPSKNSTSGHQVAEAPMEDILLNDSPAIQSTDAASTSTPQMLTSDSFSKLPHQPSPFDNISGASSLTAAGQQFDHNLLGTPSHSSAHSRQSSYGGNVEFIVGGSESASQEHSQSGSPYTFKGDVYQQQVSLFPFKMWWLKDFLPLHFSL